MRWQVPVDDQDHGVPAHGPVVACGTTEGLWRHGPTHWVEFWTVDRAEHPATDPTEDRVFRVFGTGQPIPDGYVWRATADREDGLVWHLFERVGAE